MKLSQVTESEFLTWLQEQLRKREFIRGYRFSKEELCNQLYEILFCENKLTMEEVELYLFPFKQSGYLSARNKFELMLFVLYKDGWSDADFLLNLLEADQIITAEKIDELYLEWSLENRLILSEEEKTEFFLKNISEKIGLGVLEVLLEIAPEGILMGELCPTRYEKMMEMKIAIRKGGDTIYLPFLEIEDEEQIRIIKQVVACENRGELTCIEPIWDCVRDNGTCITATRPPVGTRWGLRILYSAAGREQRRWFM